MQIDFYILKNQKSTALFSFACRLLMKVYDGNHKAYIQTLTEADANELNQLLWTFSDASFIPHCLVSDDNKHSTPIVIGAVANPLPNLDKDIFINFTADIPVDYAHYQRIIEIVPNEEPWRNQSRQKYIKYKELNAGDIKTHEI